MIGGAAGQGRWFPHHRLLLSLSQSRQRCNEMRNGEGKRISEAGIRGTRNRLELPSFAEGFDDCRLFGLL